MAKYTKPEDRVEPNAYISEEGTYLFKIVKHEVDGYTNESNEKHKYTMEAQKIETVDGKPKLSNKINGMTNIYTEDEKQYWVFGNLMDALKIAYNFNEADLVGYYFVATVKSRMYNDKKYFDIDPRTYRYSVANDKLPPVPEAKAEEPMQQQSYETQQELVDEAELLF